MRPIALIHRATLDPAIAILDEMGAPTANLLRREGLPIGHNATSGYLPLRSTLAFSNNAAAFEGLWDFGFRIAERVTLGRAGRWGPRVLEAVTLRHAIETMRNWAPLDMPELRIGLEKRNGGHWFWREHRPNRRHYPGYWVGEQYILALMVEIVRMAEGPDWRPRRLEIEVPAREWAGKRPEFAGEALIEFGAARTAIELPARSLDRRLHSAGSDPAVKLLRDGDEPPAVNLKGSLRQVLKPIAYEKKLTLSLGASLLARSERTLQRDLASEGTSWREVVERVQLETAVDLMDEPTNSLADIAAALGYSQYPHFYRAFERWTGQSPREYRKTLAS